MDLVCLAVDPMVQLVQNFFDISFTVMSFFGFGAPNVRSLFGGIIGCDF